MAKIMLVEDDNNLREIYQARLLAEGYEIVAAKDGEEALALAVKEKPDLIIADIMMPKISGFDMLDILRSTAETKETKVIVMTALSQAEDKTRADKLGANRYLVKSQVTLEDVAKAAQEVLTGSAPSPAAPAPPTTSSNEPPTAEPPTTDQSAATSIPVQAAPIVPIAIQPSEPAQADQGQATTPIPQISTNETSSDAVKPPSREMAAVPSTVAPAPAPTPAPLPPSGHDSVELPSAHKKVIEPINDLTTKPDLNALLAKEEGKEHADEPVDPPPTNTVIEPGTPISLPQAAASEAEPEPHQPGQIFGPQQTPGSDPGDPNAVSL